MTDKELAIALIRRLQLVDDTCMTCAYNNPNADVCANIINTEICYEGIKAFMVKELNNGETPKN